MILYEEKGELTLLKHHQQKTRQILLSQKGQLLPIKGSKREKEKERKRERKKERKKEGKEKERKD